MTDSSVADLRASLGSIEKALSRFNRRVVGLLQPGLPVGEIEDRLAAHGLAMLDELLALYAWRDGTDATSGVSLDEMQFIPGFYLLSLGDALTNYEAFTKSSRWSPTWLPLLANGGGDFLLVDTSDEHRGCAIRHFRIEEDRHPVEYESIANMAATFAAAYERSVFYIDTNGYLEVDDNVYAALAEELNPTVGWWTE